MQILNPYYKDSHALIIGINSYLHADQLQYAKSDAEAVAKVLIDKFNFPEKNVKILIDKEATAFNIRKAYASFGSSDYDDRVLFFFAGHGHSIEGNSQDVGFLVPHEGDPRETSSLMQWKEFIGGLELIPAKHVLFIIDACFSGLFIKRSLAGGQRFVDTLLKKRSCQALTAGKSDEAVSDGGGPRKEHSIFTGHLLDALERDDAVTPEGFRLASTVMNYVFTHVGPDLNSEQIPQYGHITGEGEFIFDAGGFSIEKPIEGDEENFGDTGANQEIDEGAPDKKIETPLVTLPESLSSLPPEEDSTKEELERILQLEKNEIPLDRFINRFLSPSLSLINRDRYPNSQEEISTNEKIANRIQRYESDMENLREIVMILSRWGKDSEFRELKKIFYKIAEVEKDVSGLTFLIDLQWYPVHLLVYSCAIAALASENVEALKALLEPKIRTPFDSTDVSIVVPAITHISSIQEWFKNVSGNENHYVPRSEYLFQFFQPLSESILFVGNGYEECFDEAEVFLALAYIKKTGRPWGPIGRFGYKHAGRYGKGAYAVVLEKMNETGSFWNKIYKEVFGESEDFKKNIEEYTERLNKLGWF